MLYRKIVTVCSEIHTKHINKVRAEMQVIRAEMIEILFLYGIGPRGLLQCYQLLTSRYGVINQQNLIQDLHCLL